MSAGQVIRFTRLQLHPVNKKPIGAILDDGAASVVKPDSINDWGKLKDSGDQGVSQKWYQVKRVKNKSNILVTRYMPISSEAAQALLNKPVASSSRAPPPRESSPIRIPLTGLSSDGQSISGPDVSNSHQGLDRSGTGQKTGFHLIAISGKINNKPAIVAVRLHKSTWSEMLTRNNKQPPTKAVLIRLGPGRFKLDWSLTGKPAERLWVEFGAQWDISTNRYSELINLRTLEMAAGQRGTPNFSDPSPVWTQAQAGSSASIALTSKNRYLGPGSWTMHVKLEPATVQKIQKRANNNKIERGSLRASLTSNADGRGIRVQSLNLTAPQYALYVSLAGLRWEASQGAYLEQAGMKVLMGPKQVEL